MGKSIETTLIRFEEQLNRLLQSHKELERENNDLISILLEKEQRYENLHNKFTAMEQNYANLKQAKVISLSDEEIDITRERLSKLVREIDQCIESLSKSTN